MGNIEATRTSTVGAEERRGVGGKNEEKNLIPRAVPSAKNDDCTINTNTKELPPATVPYRRFYPKCDSGFNSNFRQQNQRKISTAASTLDDKIFHFDNKLLFEHASPLRKRLRCDDGSNKFVVAATTTSRTNEDNNKLAPQWSADVERARTVLKLAHTTESVLDPAPHASSHAHSATARTPKKVVRGADTDFSILSSRSSPSARRAQNTKHTVTTTTASSSRNEISEILEDEPSSSDCRRINFIETTGGPITKAVLTRGLRARFKSFSAWLLNEPTKDGSSSVSSGVSLLTDQSPPQGVGKIKSKTGGGIIGGGAKEKTFLEKLAFDRGKKRRVHFQRLQESNDGEKKGPLVSTLSNSSSFPAGFGSLKRWSSLRTSLSLKNVASKLRRETSHRSSLNTPIRSHDDQTTTSVASLNSLSDGRTHWPVPWLEAIFLPEFPSKGSLNEKAFTVAGTIAKGAFGRVYRVHLKTSTEQIFAMKVQSKADVISQNAVQQVKHEVSIHQMFTDYPFIAQLYGTWQSRSKLYIVLNYVSGYGDLYQLWRDEGPFREDVARIWGAELATAIDYMHANGVIYRDLKMENIMLDDNGHIQLVDFGLAKWLYYGDRTSTICGTLQYMAPEVLEGKLYNHAVDWWSLGVLLHTIMTGSYPYSTADSHALVKIDEYVPPTSISEDAQQLLVKLLRKDPSWRLRSFTLYKTQSFFRNISFDDIRAQKIHPFDYIPRMRRCDTCNVVSEEMEGLEESDLAMFEEDYDAFKNFDSFCEEVGL